MNSLVKEIIKSLLPEEERKQTTALYAGGFKPPTSGHFEVVLEALKQNPEIDEFIIFVGSKDRNGISQNESLLIWEIYNKYLPFKVKIEPSSLPPIKAVYDFAKNHPTREILWVLGAREGNEDDFKDLSSRTRSITNYPNIEVRTIITQGGVSGTAARNAAKVSFEKFEPFMPSVLTPEEKQEVYQIVSGKVQEILNENASYSNYIDCKQKIKELTKYYYQKYPHIKSLPKVKFIHGDKSNAKQFLGKTAYYDPSTQTIVLYTEGRHPKDIVRSFSHEMVHHIQNLEGRLGNIATTNTLEDDHLDKIEQEANLNGTMTFRNWTDSLNEAIVGNKIVCEGCGWSWNIKDGGNNPFTCHKCGYDNTPLQEKKSKDPFGLNAYAMELGGLREEETNYTIYCDLDGVLVDFDRGYKELTGITSQQADANGAEVFWAPLSKAGAKFWITLKWMSDGKQLWDYIRKYNPILLSAPSREESSKLGKRVWVKRELPNIKLILRPADRKQEFADSTSILIDDREKNIEQWKNAGGIGILHINALNTIKQLQELGL
jgi:hypothetical protein